MMNGNVMEYRGVKIDLHESSGFTTLAGGGPTVLYTVKCTNGLVFAAYSKCGTSFAKNPEDALTGAKSLIDCKGK